MSPRSWADATTALAFREWRDKAFFWSSIFLNLDPGKVGAFYYRRFLLSCAVLLLFLLSGIALVLRAYKNRAVHLCTGAVSLGCSINLRGHFLFLFSALVSVSLNWDL